MYLFGIKHKSVQKHERPLIWKNYKTNKNVDIPRGEEFLNVGMFYKNARFILQNN